MILLTINSECDVLHHGFLHSVTVDCLTLIYSVTALGYITYTKHVSTDSYTCYAKKLNK